MKAYIGVSEHDIHPDVFFIINKVYSIFFASARKEAGDDTLSMKW